MSRYSVLLQGRPLQGDVYVVLLFCFFSLRMAETTMQNISFFPQFCGYLLSEEVGFTRYVKLGVPKAKTQGSTLEGTISVLITSIALN